MRSVDHISAGAHTYTSEDQRIHLPNSRVTVSYTHLTLPTMLWV